MHDVTKLPKWAQQMLEEKEREIERLNTKELPRLADKLHRLEQAHAVLTEREWFTIPGPLTPDMPDSYNLFILRTNSVHPVCSVGRGDTLLVGRARKR